MNVLINGASGYIGYHLTKEMLNADHNVYAVCRSSVGHLGEFEGNRNLVIITTTQDKLKEKIADLKIDVWYQLLWDGAVGEKRSDALLQLSNEIMYVEAMKIAESIGCRKIIFTGTVYENFADDIIKNETENIHSFYIIAKKHAHDLTYQLSKSMKIQYIWVQFCHPVGKYMNKSQLFPYAVNAFSNNLPTSFGSCQNWFDIISVEYLCEALRLLGEKNVAKPFYYVGSGNPRILKDYLEEAAKICGYSLPIGFGKRPDDGLAFKKEWFNSALCESVIGNECYDKCEEIVISILKG